MMIFVVGIGRSGTSLLQSMIAAREDVAFLPETVFIRRFIVERRLAKARRRPDVDRVTGLLEEDRYFARTGLDARSVARRAELESARLDDVAVYRAMVREFADRSGTPHAADKDPRSIEHPDLLLRLFDDSRIVCTLRDPRDVLASRKKAAWSRESSLLRHLLVIRVQSRIAARFAARLPRRSFVIVRYEDLLEDPERTLRTMCTSLELRFDEAMLSFSESARALVADDEMSWKKETLGPLLTGNQGKWRTELSNFEVAALERICRYAFDREGYRTSRAIDRVGAAERSMIALLGAVAAVLDPAYRAYRELRVLRASAGA